MTPAVKIVIFMGIVCVPIQGGAGQDAYDAAELCDQAADDAARQSGVPAAVLRALTRTETGRGSQGALRPWPWAINHAGEGSWLASEADMLGQMRALLDAGQTNFDVGCFQLNYRWHADAFASLEAMADPVQNARYAAHYIRQKFAVTGDWATAAAAYHSGTPEFAARYLARFARIYASSDEIAPPPGPTIQDAERPNLFPLLIAGYSGGGGSLVPMAAAGRRPFAGNE
jgi:hypothetical protein